MEKKRAVFLALAFVLIPSLAVYARGNKDSSSGGKEKASASSASVQYAFYSADSPANFAGEGTTRKVLAHTDNLMVCELDVATGGGAPMHNHPEEQISYVVSGTYEYTVGDVTVVVGPGDTVYAPSDVPHTAVCLEAGVMLDVFTPERKDLLPGFDASANGGNKANTAVAASSAGVQYVFYSADSPANFAGEGTTRKVLGHTDNLMVCELNVATGGTAPMHSHPEEQISYIVSGKFEFTVGEETMVLGLGDSVYMPGDVPHTAVSLEEGVMLDIFTPERKDLLPQ